MTNNRNDNPVLQLFAGKLLAWNYRTQHSMNTVNAYIGVINPQPITQKHTAPLKYKQTTRCIKTRHQALGSGYYYGVRNNSPLENQQPHAQQMTSTAMFIGHQLNHPMRNKHN